MKKFIIFLITLFVGTGIFFWILKTVGWTEIKNVFLTFSGLEGVIILILTVFITCIDGLKWKMVLKNQGYNVSLRELAGLRFASFSIVFFAPILILGGDIFRTYILREKKSIPWQDGMASVIIDRILEWTCNLVIILAGFTFFIYKIAKFPQKLEIILGSALVVFITLSAFFYLRSFKKQSIVRIFIKSRKNHFLEIEKEVFKFFQPKKIVMWKGFTIAFIRGFVAFLRCWLILLFLGKGLAFLPALPILSFYFLALLVPIPAALGSHDALQAFGFGAMGFGANTGTAFAMIVRAADLIAALIGAVILLKLGLELLKIILLKKIDIFSEFSKNSKE